MAENAPGWLERVLLPQISDLKAEIKIVNARNDALDKKLSTRIDGLSSVMDDVDKRLGFKIVELD